MNLSKKLEYKLMQLLSKLLGFTLNIEEKGNSINLNVKILNKKGRKNFIKLINKVSEKLNKQKGRKPKDLNYGKKGVKDND